MAGSVFAKLHARMGSISRKEICTNELMVQLQAFKISARFVAPNVHSRPLGPSVPSTHANGGLRERERAYIHGVQRLERHLSRERMWLCMMRALELQSPWCTPERHHDELKEAQKKLHEDDDRESVRHGPHSSHGKEVEYHTRARFQMI